ncbi:MarR family winged helix-turn-helix transcriptional regulator [Halothiobacillus sp.]|jgi:MarR family transcriptional regulator for hemolysin|uniref:MarR family winged helix-turn-helix transcriptional regulator n=1 Tax=Halothiobacillus sp. TaxID=1891311 RepID=UPI0029835369|nr:MarR family transcriptional regulator [Halothiobacillus sp.]MDY0146726.1 MarR family transcriptional regulator [Halothiobacillus sp.]
MLKEHATMSDEQIARLLFDTSRMWRSQLNTVLAEYDLTASAWSVIRVLRDEGQGRTQKELASALAIEGPTLVKLLDSLERLNWIERRVAPTDRRAKTIWLIDSALPQIKEADMKLGMVRHSIVDVLDQGERQDYIRLMSKLKHNLEQMCHESNSEGDEI